MSLRDRISGHYSGLETETPGQRSRRTWAELTRLVAHAYETSREFRARMDEAELNPAAIRSWNDWPKIPKFSKKDLIALQQSQGLAAMLACDLGTLGRIYMSPGPIFDPEGRGSDYWGWTEAFFAAGFRKGDLVQMTFSYHLTPAGLMLEEPLRELGCAVIPAGPGNTEVQIELMTRLPVTGFVGMASYLKVIKDKARELGLDLSKDIGLEVAFVAAERLAPSLRQELEDELGMRVRQGYGTADIGCIAYECQELSGMHLSSRCHVEIVDPKTGQPLPVGATGEVVVTPFTDSYPLLRLATGDLSRLVAEPCACGRTSMRLAGILGRADDTAKVKGQFIYPHQVAEVVASFPVIERWQVVVDNPGGKDALTLRLAIAEDLDAEAFAKAFQAKLKLRPRLVVEPAAAFAADATPLVDKRKFE